MYVWCGFDFITSNGLKSRENRNFPIPELILVLFPSSPDHDFLCHPTTRIITRRQIWVKPRPANLLPQTFNIYRQPTLAPAGLCAFGLEHCKMNNDSDPLPWPIPPTRTTNNSVPGDSQSDLPSSKNHTSKNDSHCRNDAVIQSNHSEYTAESEDEQKCSICLANAEEIDRAIVVVCGHIFCTNCILTWWDRHRNCPLCRKKFKELIVRRRYDGSVLDMPISYPAIVLRYAEWVEIVEQAEEELNFIPLQQMRRESRRGGLNVLRGVASSVGASMSSVFPLIRRLRRRNLNTRETDG